MADTAVLPEVMMYQSTVRHLLKTITLNSYLYRQPLAESHIHQTIFALFQASAAV
jgi:hypothetical protein